MDTLRDKVATITGAGSGIGRAIACEMSHAKFFPVHNDENRSDERA